jgi:hypothetical protein
VTLAYDYGRKLAFDASEVMPADERRKIFEQHFPRIDMTPDEEALAAKLHAGAKARIDVSEHPTVAQRGGALAVDPPWDTVPMPPWAGKYHPEGVIVMAPEHAKNPYVTAHELGHLSVARSPGGRLLQAGRGLQALKPFATMGSALHPTRTGRLLSAVAGAATTLPRNYDEHKAWEHGEELLQQHGITDAQRVESDAVKRRALSSYWLDTADTLVNNLGVMGLREGYDYWRRSR